MEFNTHGDPARRRTRAVAVGWSLATRGLERFSLRCIESDQPPVADLRPTGSRLSSFRRVERVADEEG